MTSPLDFPLSDEHHILINFTVYLLTLRITLLLWDSSSNRSLTNFSAASFSDAFTDPRQHSLDKQFSLLSVQVYNPDPDLLFLQNLKDTRPSVRARPPAATVSFASNWLRITKMSYILNDLSLPQSSPNDKLSLFLLIF